MKYNGKTIKKRKDRNCWYIRFYHNKKQYTLYGRTQKDVIEKYKKLKKQNFQNLNVVKNNEYTLLLWFEEFLKLYKNNKVKDTTLKSYYYDFMKLQCLHNFKMKDLKAVDIQKVLNTIKHPSTQKRLYILLNTLFEKALINEIVSKNIIKLIDPIKYKPEQKISLTKQEEKLFISSCQSHKFGDYYLICLYQGLRKGECRGLRVNDIDFENKTLRIDESLNTHTTRTDTKNNQSKRIMPLFEKSIEILKRNVKGKSSNDFVFDIGVNRVDKALKEITSNIDIRKITTHILRHTFITRCQELNIPLFIIQSWVGHEKGSVVTTKIYTHYNVEENQKHIEKFNSCT